MQEIEENELYFSYVAMFFKSLCRPRIAANKRFGVKGRKNRKPKQSHIHRDKQ